MIMYLGYIIQFVVGLIGLLIWFGIWIDWLGSFLGFILGMMFSPGVVVFPLVYYLIEGTLPIMYLYIWVLGVVGVGITYIGAMIEGE